MTTITQSNKSSAVIQSLLKYSNDDELIYKFDYGLPNFSREIVTDSVKLTGNAQNVVFNIIKGGILKSIWMETDVASDEKDDNYTDGAINWINQISLMNNNRSLEDIYPMAIRAHINSLPFHEQYKMNVGCNYIAKTNSQVAFRNFIYLPFSFSKHPSKYLDTNYLDSLTLNISFNAYSTVAVQQASTTAPGLSTQPTCIMHYEYLILDADSYAKYREMQFPSGKPTTFLWSNYETETPTACSGTKTTTSVSLTSKRAVSKTFLKVVSTGTSKDKFYVNPLNQVAGVFPLTITLKGNGKTLYSFDALAYQIFNSKSCHPGLMVSGTAGSTLDSTTTGIDGNFIIHWDLAEAQLGDCYKGGLSLKNIANPQIEIVFAAQTATTDYIYITHEYLNLVEVEPNSGRLSISAGN